MILKRSRSQFEINVVVAGNGQSAPGMAVTELLSQRNQSGGVRLCVKVTGAVERALSAIRWAVI